MIETDKRGQRYVDIPIEGAAVRVTLVPHGWSDSPCMRVQIREENGHLRQGPDIPLSVTGDVTKAILDLINE